MILSLLFITIAKLPIRSPWKDTLRMTDLNYLPIVPIFRLTKIADQQFFIDSLTEESYNGDNRTITIIKLLNRKENVNLNIQLLQTLCDTEHNPKACLAYGRIFEFGSYNQTENHTIAIQYYQKAVKYNDTDALGLLSFYHRYYKQDLALSILEADVSSPLVENIIPKSIQQFEGHYRPKSCPTSTRSLLGIGAALSSMSDFVFDVPDVNASEYERMKNSTDPKDLYTLGLIHLTEPYPSSEDILISYKYLQSAYSKGYVMAGTPLAFTAFLQGNLTLSDALFSKQVKIHDVRAIYLFAIRLLSNNDIDDIRDGRNFMQEAKHLGFMPAIYQDAVYSYLGLYGYQRDARTAHKGFIKAATFNFLPASYQAANQLIGGDGAVVNCEVGYNMLMKMIDYGPWTTFLERYVSRGSEIAFLKMMDMGLTPNKVIKTNKIEKTKKIDRGDEYLKNIRLARNGDAAALIWLALESPLDETEEYLQKIASKEPAISILETPLRMTIFFKHFMGYMRGEYEQNTFFTKCFQTILNFVLILTLFMTLCILVFARLKYTLESK